MSLLVLGLIAFFALHLLPAFPGVRAGLVARFGLTAFRIALSVASIGALWLLIAGFAAAQVSPQNMQLWRPPEWSRHVAYTLMLPAFVLLASSFIPSRIRDLSRHPILIAVEIWAFAHLLANGDLAGAILFGAFLVWAILDHVSVHARRAGNLFGVKAGRARGDALAIAVGLAAWAFMLLAGHRLLIGLPLLG